jgi:inorganic pyrophosphatase
LERFKPHPWHGISPGEKLPEVVTVFVEIVPTDTVKFEIDKTSGYLIVDRPQRYTSSCPVLYGFIPQTYCGDRIGKLCASKLKRKRMKGDGDPLDICVISERPILHGGILVKARPVGVFRLVDRGEADDKIVAVLDGDSVYSEIREVKELPPILLDRIKHYFLTYKQMPDERLRKVEIFGPYGKNEAVKIIRTSVEDYKENFRLEFVTERYLPERT